MVKAWASQKRFAQHIVVWLKILTKYSGICIFNQVEIFK